MKINDTYFIPWFIGFIDAEGNFQVTFAANKNKSTAIITSYTAHISIHIGLSIVDKDLLFYIQEKLGGIGKIYIYPHRNEVHYYINKKDLPTFIEKVFSEHSLLTIHQYNRYCLLKHILVNNLTNYKTTEQVDNIKSMTMKIVSPFHNSHKHIEGWIVGFVNGEGSFGVYKNDSVFRFYVEHTDREVLELIKITIDLSLNITARTTRKGRKPTFTVNVSSKKDIQKVINFFEKNPYLIGNKLNQYISFRDKWIDKHGTI